MFNALQPWHIIVLVVVLIALFGAKRLPDAAKGIGKSMRIFKAETKAMRGDGSEDEDGDQSAKSAKGSTAELPAAKSSDTVKSEAEEKTTSNTER